MIKNSFLLIGSPNVGKSTIFNKITWKFSQTANYDNVTSEKIKARVRRTKDLYVIDTPGLYSLYSNSNNEKDIVNFLLSDDYEYTTNVIGANSMKRDLLTTIDLLESGTLKYLVINMIDELKNKKINIFSLERMLGIKVFQTSGLTGKGVKVFNNFLVENSNKEIESSNIQLPYPKKIIKFINEFKDSIPLVKVSSTFIITQALLNNEKIIEFLKKWNIYNKFLNLKNKLKINDIDIQRIKEIKQQFVSEIIKKCVTLDNDYKNKKSHTKFNNFMKELTFNPFFLIFTFIVVLAAIYYITFGEYAGGYIVNQINNGFDTLKEMMKSSMQQNGIDEWSSLFFTDGFFNGIFTTLSFIPWIMLLTFFTVILEQVGFLSRISIATDDVLDKFGISGRTIVNLVMGTGCNVPSIIMAKNANNVKEKVITMMILPLITCSARTVVFGWIVNAFNISHYNFLVILSLTIFSIIVSLFMGLVFSDRLFRKQKTIFLTEIVSFRFPCMWSVLKKCIYESFDFLRRVIFIIAVANLVIWLLGHLGPYGTSIQLEKSFLHYISIPFKYLLYPIGLGDDWRFSVSLIGSFPAKELAASTIENLFLDPEGFKQAIYSNAILGSARITTYISFFMFYIPCLATMVVMKKELGWKYLLINLISIFCATYIFSCIIFNVVGSISTFINNKYFHIENLVIFILTVIFFVITIATYVVKIKYQTIEKYQDKKINISYKILFFSLFLVFFGLVISNNILMIVAI